MSLLQAGAKLNQENERGTPLHAAIVTGQVSSSSVLFCSEIVHAPSQVPVVTALLDKNADPQLPDKQWGMKALHAAAFFGKPELCQLLVLRKGE